MRYSRKKTISWFLFGLGSQLQIVASLSIQEVIVLIATPFLMSTELRYMRRNGLMTFWWLSIALLICGAISCFVNHTSPPLALRGMAVLVLLPCSILVGHWMLRRDMSGFKWMLLGIALSNILCTFVFQRSVEVAMLAHGVGGSGAVEDIMSGPLYWISRINALLMVPAKGWYLQCPLFYCVGAPLFMVGFAMMTSDSGRSAALGALGMVTLVILGGKKRHRMRMIGKYFWLIMIVGIILIFVFKSGYSYAATEGLLGEKAQRKYEQQMQGKTGIGRMIIGGRASSFVGLLACVDRPILGFGPWAEDRWGYNERFIRQFGSVEDNESLMQMEVMRAMTGSRLRMIGCHSYITQFWLWYGVFGLAFWLYVVYVLMRYLAQDCWAAPHWFMWVAASIPSFMWGIFFSPFADRVNAMMLITAALMARAVRRGRQPMPIEMVMEIEKAERK